MTAVPSSPTPLPSPPLPPPPRSKLKRLTDINCSIKTIKPLSKLLPLVVKTWPQITMIHFMYGVSINMILLVLLIVLLLIILLNSMILKVLLILLVELDSLWLQLHLMSIMKIKERLSRLEGLMIVSSKIVSILSKARQNTSKTSSITNLPFQNQLNQIISLNIPKNNKRS